MPQTLAKRRLAINQVIVILSADCVCVLLAFICALSYNVQSVYRVESLTAAITHVPAAASRCIVELSAITANNITM